MAGDFKVRGHVLSAELQGTVDVLNNLANQGTFYLDSELRSAWGSAFNVLAASVKSTAPWSKYPYISRLKGSRSDRTSSRPGLLKQSIHGGVFRLAEWRRWGPAGFTQVRLKRGSKPFAPHAWLVQHGRPSLTATGKKFSFFGTSGRLTFQRHVAAAPANDFWKRGTAGVSTAMVYRLKRALETAWNKRLPKAA